MAEDGRKEEEKFDFTTESEGYISSVEVKVLAMKTANGVLSLISILGTKVTKLCPNL